MQRNSFCPGQVDITCFLTGRLHSRKKLLNAVSEYEIGLQNGELAKFVRYKYNISNECCLNVFLT